MIEKLATSIQLTENALDDVQRQFADDDHVWHSHVYADLCSFKPIAEVCQSCRSGEETPSAPPVCKSYRHLDRPFVS